MQQYNELNKIVNIIDTIFTNSKNSKTSDHHWLLFNFSDKVDLKRSDKYVAPSNLANIIHGWKNITRFYRNNKFKIYRPTWNEKFELPHESSSV